MAPLSEQEALNAASAISRFDVAIICYRMWAGATRRVIRIFRENNPRGKLVVVARIYGEVPEIEGDRYVVGADGPDALLEVLGEMDATSARDAQ